MAGTNVKPKCRWCGKDCKPNYSIVCTDCKHLSYKHRIHNTDQRKACSAEGCFCQKVFTWLPHNQAPDGFVKQLRGYGIYDEGLFCTKGCAVAWSSKYAPQVADIVRCLYECGMKINAPETVAGAVRNLAQVAMAIEDIAKKA